MQLYWSIIRPTVIYGCEMYVLKGTIKTKLMIYERKVLRKIFGPTKERDDTWRIKTNDELDKLIRHKNVINYIYKSTKVKLVCPFTSNVNRERMVKKYVNGNRC